MSTHPRTAASTRQRTAVAPPPLPTSPPPSREAMAARRKTAAEIAALLRLAELDAAALRRPAGDRPAALDASADERRALGTRISHEVLDAYHRAMRGGRQPAVTRVVGSVCYGCFVRLHAKLDHQVRHHRGVGSCPHCLRVVYDPAWLEDPSKGALER